MIKSKYDYVYLTNTPSFYKLNLCDALGKDGVKGLVVFYGYGSEAVNKVLAEGDKWHFDFKFLHDGESDKRGFWSTFSALRRLMRTIKTGCVIYSGWLSNEYNLYSFLSSRRRNVMVVESTPAESIVTGIKGWIKRRIVGRMSGALPSGKPHDDLLKLLGFKGESVTTGSVGLFYQPKREISKTDLNDKSGYKYLYVGRLIDCKNLEFLVEQFNKSGRQLTIVGKGELECRLREMANSNITFKGFVDNDNLPEIYRKHNVFILPSKSETWGMVVEEAIYWGLPVLVSDRVGSGYDMVETLGTGLIFKLGSEDDFEDKCLEIEKKYSNFVKSCANVDFNQRALVQTDAFKTLILKRKVQ